MLSKRLQQVAQTVKNGELIADIGTDHAYIPIYLIKNKIAKKAIAADISKGSCKKASLNINLRGLSDLIDVRCGNGLEVIKENEEPNVIVIAGMGGLMTISVLESNKRAVQCADQLVLQPQRDIDKVRKYIHSIGFKIESEKMLKEGDKFYNIINAVKGCEEYTEIEYLFGKKLMEERSSVLKEYVDTENNKLLTVLENMKNAAKENTADYERLNRLSEKYNEVMKCL